MRVHCAQQIVCNPEVWADPVGTPPLGAHVVVGGCFVYKLPL